MAEITGVLSTVNALEPQDIEVTPGDEDITITADEGCYIRSVVVKAIPPTDKAEDEEDGTEIVEEP